MMSRRGNRRENLRHVLLLLRALLIPVVVAIAAIKFSCDGEVGERSSTWPIAALPPLPGLSTSTFVRNDSSTSAEGWIAVDSAQEGQARFQAYCADLRQAGWKPVGAQQDTFCSVTAPSLFRCIYTADRQTANGHEELTVEMAGLGDRGESEVRTATVFLRWRVAPLAEAPPGPD